MLLQFEIQESSSNDSLFRVSSQSNEQDIFGSPFNLSINENNDVDLNFDENFNLNMDLSGDENNEGFNLSFGSSGGDGIIIDDQGDFFSI